MPTEGLLTEPLGAHLRQWQTNKHLRGRAPQGSTSSVKSPREAASMVIIQPPQSVQIHNLRET
jgi:hypothetical protein